jgi:hypothetical protein
MYYPILKGKQFELAALRELIGHIPLNNVCPILEPVNVSLGPLASTISELSSVGVNPWVVINPSQSEFLSRAGSNISVALSQQLSIINDGAGRFVSCIKIIDEDDVFARALLREASGPFVAYVEGEISAALLAELMRASVVVLNGGKNRNSLWRNLRSVVLYHDGFQKKSRNLDYPPESSYASLHIDYRNFQNVIGFADYTILCERLMGGGGPAYVVTIHLSYLDPSRSNHMLVRHFSSFSDNESQSDPAGKFREALTLLVGYVASNPLKFINTVGLQEFFDLHTTGHYPGLGVVKKISIKHHVQTLSTW